MNSRSERRIAHLADLHFDSEHLDDALASFRFACAEAIGRGCHALVLAGDIWDRGIAVNDRSPLMPVVKEIQAVAAFMPVVIRKGNHDAAGSLDIFEVLDTEHPIIVASAPRVEIVNGIHFSLLPYPYKSWLLAHAGGSQDETDFIASNALRSIIAGFAGVYAEAGGDTPHVLVFHGNVSGSQTESGQTMLGGDVMISAGDLEMSGAEYIALGHIHKRQRLGTRCYYPGSLYHCNYGELERKTMNIVRLLGDASDIEEVALPSRPKAVVDIVIGEGGEAISSQDMNADFSGMDVKIRYRITEEMTRTVCEADLARFAGEANSLRFERLIIPRERIRCETISEVRTLPEKVDAWAAAVGIEVAPSVRAKAEQLESEVQHG